MRRHWLGLALTAAVFLLDRVTKLWIEAQVDFYQTISVIPGFFAIVHSENRGMAFGLGNDGASAFTRLVLILVSLGVLGALAYFSWNSLRRGVAMTPDAWAMYLVAGGALGNLYDRVARGSVTDFLDVYLGDYHWPTFNIADCAITIGALVLIGQALRGERNEKARKAQVAG